MEWLDFHESEVKSRFFGCSLPWIRYCEGNPRPPFRGVATVSDLALPETRVTTKPKAKEDTGTRRIPPYHVILENDDHHSFEFVVEVLRKALGFNEQRDFARYQRSAHQGSGSHLDRLQRSGRAQGRSNQQLSRDPPRRPQVGPAGRDDRTGALIRPAARPLLRSLSLPARLFFAWRSAFFNYPVCIEPSSSPWQETLRGPCSSFGRRVQLVAPGWQHPRVAAVDGPAGRERGADRLWRSASRVLAGRRQNAGNRPGRGVSDDRGDAGLSRRRLHDAPDHPENRWFRQSRRSSRTARTLRVGTAARPGLWA